MTVGDIELGGDGERLAEELLDSWTLSSRVEFYFVEAPEEAVLAELRHRLRVAGAALRTVFGTNDLLRRLETAMAPVPEATTRPVVWLGGVGADRALDPEALSILNTHRSLLLGKAPAVMVLSGPTRWFRTAMEHAPDVWSVKGYFGMFPADWQRVGPDALAKALQTPTDPTGTVSVGHVVLAAAAVARSPANRTRAAAEVVGPRLLERGLRALTTSAAAPRPISLEPLCAQLARGVDIGEETAPRALEVWSGRLAQRVSLERVRDEGVGVFAALLNRYVGPSSASGHAVVDWQGFVLSLGQVELPGWATGIPEQAEAAAVGRAEPPTRQWGSMVSSRGSEQRRQGPADTKDSAIRWLHLSDLHLGARGTELWYQVQEEFLASVDQWVERLGPPDLVLITGDLAFKGAEAEYRERVDPFLDALLERLRERGAASDPVVLTVPGNHDLARPSGRAALQYRVFDEYAEGGLENPDIKLIHDELWHDRNAEFVTPLFLEYQRWADRRVISPLRAADSSVVVSHFPGDYSAVVQPSGRFPLGVVGLNSTWLQYRAGDLKGKLAVPILQFQAALAAPSAKPGSRANPLDRFQDAHRWLLLQHQPPDWLSKKAQRDFYEAIYTPDRFDLCLFGHMHEGRSETRVISGGRPRYLYQSPSLLGLEHYGESREERAIGYSWGSIDEAGEVRVWPLKRVNRGGGEGAFVIDSSFAVDETPGGRGGCVIREPDGRTWAGPRPLPTRPVPTAPPPSTDEDEQAAALAAYRAWALEHLRGIDLIGIGARDVKLPLDDVFIHLRVSSREWGDHAEAGADGDGDDVDGDIDVADTGSRKRAPLRYAEAQSLAARELTSRDIFDPALSSGRHRLVFGDPGAGKTTVLKKLAFDCLAKGPDSLGLPEGTLPLLLPLRHLTAEDLDPDRIGAAIERVLRERSEPGELPEGLGERLWRHGRLLLLLDGLDEVPGEAERERICEALRWRLTDRGRDGLFVLVSCRYAAAQSTRCLADSIPAVGAEPEAGQGFLSLDIQPLDARQVEALVNAWFHAAERALEGYTAQEAAKAAKGLIDALRSEEYGAQQLKVLVGSPLLLSLVCVIVLRGGVMPKRRVEFYRQCLDIMLSKWGSAQGRRDPPLEAEAILSVLRPVAFRLHRQHRRDDLSRVEFANLALGQPAVAEAKVDGFALLDWLHCDAGVLEAYTATRYGFMHLGLQEYLTAAHIAAESAKKPERLAELAANATDRWWREVIQLAVALPGHELFTPVVRELLADERVREALAARDPEVVALLEGCLRDGAATDAEAFAEALPGAPPPLQATLLRLVAGRTDSELVEVLEPLALSDDPEVRALARQHLAKISAVGVPAGARVFIAAHPDDRDVARELGAALEEGGLPVWGHRADSSELLDRRAERLLPETAAALVLLTEVGRWPWLDPTVEGIIGLLGKQERTLVPVWLGEGELTWPIDPDDRPVAESWGSPVATDAARPDVALLRRALEGDAAQLVRGAAPGATSHVPRPGEAFVEPITGIQMLWVPGGRFEMGMWEQPWKRFSGKRHVGGVKSWEPVHTVALSPYWIAETPVTNAQYGRFLAATKRDEPKYWRDSRFSGPEQPVVGVSWHDSVAFCDWLHAEAGQSFRLPSEAQWEYAARGTDGRIYPWGNEAPTPERCNFKGHVGRTTPVTAYPLGRGPFGTLDQAGNVWEWCSDVWDSAAYRMRADSVVNDPVVGDTYVDRFGKARVLRGGSWANDAVLVRSAFRVGSGVADFRRDDLGFRVALPAASR